MIVPIQEQAYQLAGAPSPKSIHELFVPELEVPTFEELQDGLVADLYRSSSLSQVMTIESRFREPLKSLICMAAASEILRGAYFGPAVDSRTEQLISCGQGVRHFSLWR